MRNISSICVAVMLCVAAVGCQNRHPKPMDPAAVQTIRDSYARLDPASRVGIVTEALPEKGLVAVSEMPVKEFATGDVLVFVDAKNQVIAAGKVVETTTDSLHVSYDVRGPEGREPQVGDLAVRTGR